MAITYAILFPYSFISHLPLQRYNFFFDIGKVEGVCFDSHREYGVYPSLRDIFYALVGESLPNTKSAYRGLIQYLVQKRLSGEIDWKLIRDGSGRELNVGDYAYEPPENYFDSWLRSFKNCSRSYSLPRWTDQKFKVIVLCEKEADYPAVKSVLSDLNVDVGYMRGYSGKRLMFEMAEEIQNNSKVPKILILGDFDPSGEDIKRNVGRDMKKMGLDIKPINIAITKEQIRKFKLPHIPEDMEEIDKLKKDPRFLKWTHGLYRVETASLKARQPEYFKSLLRKSVLKYFDQKIYDEVKKLEIPKRKKIQRLVEEKLA